MIQPSRIDWRTIPWSDGDASACEVWSLFSETVGDYGLDVDGSEAAFDGSHRFDSATFAFRINHPRGRCLFVTIEVEWDETPRLVSTAMEVRRV